MSLDDKLDLLLREAQQINGNYDRLQGSVLADPDAVREIQKLRRGPSKAASIGNGKPFDAKARLSGERGMRSSFGKRLSKALYGGDQDAVGTLAAAFYLMSGRDPDDYRAGKAMLASYGFERAEAPERSESYTRSHGPVGEKSDGGWRGAEHFGKATLGTTGITGGFVLPNNLVDSVQKPKTMRALYSNLVTVVSGVAVRGVDQPYRLGPPTRATFQNWGQAKENLDETYGTYTATLGTLARIYDVGKQYLRFSAGAAEQDVMDELSKAHALGENYYVVAGSGAGSTTPGVGDPTYGIYTALLAGSNTYTTAFTGAAQNTLVGSFAAAVSQAAGALAQRSRDPEAVVVDAATYFSITAQGTDAAGFWLNPSGGPSGVSVAPNGQLHMWGLPVFWDANLTTNTAAKIAIVAEWSAFRLYRGQEFRIDSSDEAGTRWDNNLVGFRAEQEIGFNAGTGVSIGAAQLITSAIA